MEDIRVMNFLEKYARITPDAPAIMDESGKTMSYSALTANVSALSEYMALCGIQPHYRVAVVMPKAFEMAVLYLAVSNIAAFVPLSADFSKEQFRYYFKILKIDSLIILPGHDLVLEDIAKEMNITLYYLYMNDLGPIVYSMKSKHDCTDHTISVTISKDHDTALVLFTSGTTGKPKIVPRSNINTVSSATQRIADFSLNEKDRVLIITAMDRAASLNILLASLISGGCAICADNFETSQMFHNIKEKLPTWFAATPIMFQMMINYAEENNINRIHSDLRFISSSGAPLSYSMVDRISQIFQVPFFNNYGLTETGWLATTANEPKGHKKGSVGTANLNTVEIMDSSGRLISKNFAGEIVARGPQVIKGYDDEEDNVHSFFAEDWFRTGDRGYLDEDGYLFITGRIKELINRGGEKISPYEVEEAILKHPAVLQCVVFPISAMEACEEAGAAVVLKKGTSLYLKELRSFLSGKIIALKMPTRLYVLNTIPSSSTQKIQRNIIYSHIKLLGIEPQPECNENETIIMPGNETEVKLYEIFRRILPAKMISVSDSFFALGGDSLKASVLYSKILKNFKIQIPLTYIFKDGSIKQLADYIVNSKPDHTIHPFVVPFQRDGSKTPVFFIHAEEGEAFIYRHLANSFDPERPFYAISFNPERGNWSHPITFEQIARHYIEDIRSIQPQGPYILAGQCVGGVIAYEMAQQLTKANQSIGFLALFDSLLPVAATRSNFRDKLNKNFNELQNYGFNILSKFVLLKLKIYENRLLKYLYKNSFAGINILFYRLLNKGALVNCALSNYTVKEYDGKIIYFKPLYDPKPISEASIGIWSQLVKEVEIVLLKGDHNSVFYEENAENTRLVFENMLADLP